MSQKAVIHSILLLVASGVTFLWVTNQTLSEYDLQLTAILMLVLVISRYFIKPNSFKLVESLISTIAIILVVVGTGGLTSPLFFLNFFLLFELSLLLEPIIPLIISAALMCIYFTLGPEVKSIGDLAILLSFPFMTPLAIFLGKIYRKEENQKKQIQNLENKLHTIQES